MLNTAILSQYNLSHFFLSLNSLKIDISSVAIFRACIFFLFVKWLLNSDFYTLHILNYICNEFHKDILLIRCNNFTFETWDFLWFTEGLKYGLSWAYSDICNSWTNKCWAEKNYTVPYTLLRNTYIQFEDIWRGRV